MWQNCKTLPGAMGHTRMAAKGSYNRQSQQTSAIPRPKCPLFSFLESVVKYWQIGCCKARRASRQGGSVAKTLPGARRHTRMAAKGSYSCQSQQTSAIPRPKCPLFSFLESVVKHWQIGFCEARR